MEKIVLNNNRAKGMTLAVLTAVMWGIMGLFVRGLTAQGFSSMEISFFRCFIAGAAYFLYQAVRNPGMLKIDLKGLLICLLYGAAAYSVSFVSYTVAVSRIPVGVATVLMFMSPIWVAILGQLLFEEKLDKITGITILLCLAGAVMVSDVLQGSFDLDGIGILAGIINGMGVALQVTLPKFFARDYERDTILVYGFLGAALVLSFGVDFPHLISVITDAPVADTICNLFGIGILCTMVANVSCVKATQYITVTTTSILSALEVVVGTAVGFLVFHESLTAVQIIGAVIIVAGSVGSEVLKANLQKG